MNKSKFASVRFKPFDIELLFQTTGLHQGCWTNDVIFGKALANDVYFTDSCIETYPELFETIEREFEEGAFYKVKLNAWSKYEVVAFYGNRFFRIGQTYGFPKADFCEIGERVEL